MKKITILLYLITSVIIAQKEKSTNLNRANLSELKMSFYEKDSTAKALVLYEQVNRYPDRDNDEIPRIDYYFRIKIFDKSAFDLADIEIYLRKSEQLSNFSAFTYNLTETGTMNRTKLDAKNIFTLDKQNGWTLKKTTLPNVKEGSIIEYKYSISSPYLAIDDWYFQSDIPKLKSEFNASILGNYLYNIKLVGFLKLDINETSVDKKCVNVDHIGFGSCAVYTYIMKDIPAFVEEDYMLSKKNYISKVSFDLKSRRSYLGDIKKFTTTWEKADQNLKKLFFNKQTSKTSFFSQVIPPSILTTKDKLERAQKIYTFIQNHYTWNGDFWTNSDAKVKNAFKQKSGDVGEINLSLFNSLEAADIKAKLVVLSTRNNGIPTKIYPIIFDYNYVIVEASINNKKYYLDATDPFLPFGQVPFRTINGEARVLDFDEESKWIKLKPKFNSSMNTNVKITIK